MDRERRAFLLAASTLAAATAVFKASAREVASAPSIASESLPLPKNAASRFLRVNDINMHYVTVGSGPAVVLLHGWPQTWFAWRNVMEGLSSRFTLIAPDLRGLGLSERTAAGYDKKTIASDVRALIDAVAAGRAHVVGHDMGGKAAFTLANLNPDKIEKLVLVDCLIPGTENMDASRGGAWHYGFHMAPDFPEMLTKGRERDYIASQIRAWSHRKDAIGEAEISEYARYYATDGGMTAGFNYYRALREDAALLASFAEKPVSMPVLTLAGRYGVGEKLAAGLQGRAVNLTSLIAEDSGHFIAEEAPDYFCEKVGQFLAS